MRGRVLHVYAISVVNTSREKTHDPHESFEHLPIRAKVKGMLIVTATTLMTILLLSASAWAGNHQICYQVPAPPGALQGRFLCRTDGVTVPLCNITSVKPADPYTSGFASHQGNTFYGGAEFYFSTPGTYVGTITFDDGTVRSCTVEVSQGAFIDPNLQLIGYGTDASGLVMTGVWQGTSAPADQAIVEVYVPPDFVAVGGGAEGTESPGTLVNGSSNNIFNPRSWFARQYDFRAVRLTSGAQRGLASSRPEPHVLLAHTSVEVSHGRV